MSGLIKKIFIRLLSSIVNAFNQTKCVLLSNQKYEIQFTHVNLHSNEYNQKFHYYPFLMKIDSCIEICDTLIDLSNRVCIPNKTEDLNLSVFNITIKINESKTLKGISFEL